MAALIAENSYLIPKSVKVSYAQEGKLMLSITSLDSDDSEIKDPVI